jgi:hypothetical protein
VLRDAQRDAPLAAAHGEADHGREGQVQEEEVLEPARGEGLQDRAVEAVLLGIDDQEPARAVARVDVEPALERGAGRVGLVREDELPAARPDVDLGAEIGVEPLELPDVVDAMSNDLQAPSL